MTSILQAFRQYGPRLGLSSTAQLGEVSNWMSMRTGANKSEIIMILQELSDAILYFNNRGIPVKIPGVGTFTPSIDRRGTIKNHFRADMALKKGSNAPDAYKGEVLNKGRIGLDNEGYKALWDADHPDDPLEI